MVKIAKSLQKVSWAVQLWPRGIQERWFSKEIYFLNATKKLLAKTPEIVAKLLSISLL